MAIGCDRQELDKLKEDQKADVAERDEREKNPATVTQRQKKLEELTVQLNKQKGDPAKLKDQANLDDKLRGSPRKRKTFRSCTTIARPRANA